MAPKRSTRQRIGWALVILGLALLAVWTFRLGQTVLSLRDHWVEARSWTQAPTEVNPAEACQLVQDAHADVASLHRQAGGLAQVGPAVGWLPVIGGDLRAAPHLLTVGVNISEAGAILCRVAEPVLPPPSSGSPSVADISQTDVIRQLDDHRPELEQAETAVARALSAWEQVDTQALSPPLREKAPLLDEALPLLQRALSMATVAPDLLGADEPRTYLVLALNEDEIRPGGGFISGVGEVRISAGDVVSMTFRDSYAVDDFTQPYPPAPQPMQQYMGIDLLVFRDSNWSPDFPTAARQAMELYRPGYPVSVDGVIALDQRAVQGLVTAVGPVRTEQAEGPITGETVLGYMHEAWAPGDEAKNQEWWQQRKSFMGSIAESVWQHVQSGDVDWVALARTTLRLLGRKHLLVYVPDPTVEEVLAEQGWDGALRPGSGDFLAVVDASLGYNKASAKVRQDIRYQVDLRRTPPQASLTLIYTHTSGAEVACHPEAQYAATYEGMMDRCYWNYLRVYRPAGCELEESDHIRIPGEALWSGRPDPGVFRQHAVEEAPCLVWGVMSLIPPGTSQTRQMVWTLPPDVVHWQGDEGRYTLRIQKQPGKPIHPLTVRVLLPEDAALVHGETEPPAVGDVEVMYRTDLDQDLTFDLHFRRRP